MGISAVHAGPAQVIGDPASPDTVTEGLELREVRQVERVRRSDRHRDAVKDHGVALGDLVEDGERTPTCLHVVFAEDLEPIDRGPSFEDVAIVRRTQSDTYSKLR